jgi:hypothetical protein
MKRRSIISLLLLSAVALFGVGASANPLPNPCAVSNEQASASVNACLQQLSQIWHGSFTTFHPIIFDATEQAIERLQKNNNEATTAARRSGIPKKRKS